MNGFFSISDTLVVYKTITKTLTWNQRFNVTWNCRTIISINITKTEKTTKVKGEKEWQACRCFNAFEKGLYILIGSSKYCLNCLVFSYESKDEQKVNLSLNWLFFNWLLKVRTFAKIVAIFKTFHILNDLTTLFYAEILVCACSDARFYATLNGHNSEDMQLVNFFWHTFCTSRVYEFVSKKILKYFSHSNHDMIITYKQIKNIKKLTK